MLTCVHLIRKIPINDDVFAALATFPWHFVCAVSRLACRPETYVFVKGNLSQRERQLFTA